MNYDPSEPYIGSLPDQSQSEAEPAAKQKPDPKRQRTWPLVVSATVVVLVLASWVPVLALRWRNPDVTAFMLEIAYGSGHKVRQVWVPYDRISPSMRLAVVASEDQTFPTNHGFDFRAIRKAIKHNEQGGTLHGASTITQQTAKNLFLWPGGGYFRKAIGAWFTVLIDLNWPKRRVLEMYLNIAQFGPHTFGVEAAAEKYFGKRASQLSAYEAALLAATLPDPDHFNPDRPSDYLLQRQQWILEQMQHLGSNYLASVDD